MLAPHWFIVYYVVIIIITLSKFVKSFSRGCCRLCWSRRPLLEFPSGWHMTIYLFNWHSVCIEYYADSQNIYSNMMFQNFKTLIIILGFCGYSQLLCNMLRCNQYVVHQIWKWQVCKPNHIKIVTFGLGCHSNCQTLFGEHALWLASGI